MSSKQKKKASTGVRYSDERKKEVIDFVLQYNAKNKRGGQQKAAAKFKVSALTIATWIKSSGKPAVAAKSAAAAPKAPKKGAPKGRRGVRYTPELKKEVVDFVVNYNAANGRGGQNQAASKFGISVLTVSAWLKASGKKAAAKPGRKAAPKAAKLAKKSAVKGTDAAAELKALKAALRALIG